MGKTNNNSARRFEYPTSDHRPMAESDQHRNLMCYLIRALEEWYTNQPNVYVSGNLLIYYIPGNKRKRVAPEVFVVKGVLKKMRPYYLLWEEGKGPDVVIPDVVIEVTSSSTRREDTKKKWELYRDVFKVQELFLFDPRADYLHPPLQGYRLQKGAFIAIPPLNGRLSSKVLGLDLLHDGPEIRFFNPKISQKLFSLEERISQAQEAYQKALKRIAQAIEKRQQMEKEIGKIRRELERLGKKPS